jgi:hypothetical protein
LSAARFLTRQRRLINGERQNQYGNPEDSFRLIAAFWSSYLGIAVSPRQAAEMMVLFKIARQKTGKGKRDNFVDMCGYAALAADMAEGEQA